MAGKNAIDMTGQRFGQLTVIARGEKNKWRHWSWVVRCACGKEFVTGGRNLRSGDCQSCGCTSQERRDAAHITHGMSKRGEVSGLYKSWADAKSRCSNPNVKRYTYYGGRGIVVCERWQSFENFREDMEEGWSPSMSLDRIDPAGNYEPGNCQWLTRSDNAKKAAEDRRQHYFGV